MVKRIWMAILTVTMIVFITGCSVTDISLQKQDDVKKEPVKERRMDSSIPTEVPKVGIPVLMYHMIGDIEDNPAVINPALFEEQMKYLHDNGYHTISLDALYEYVTKGTPVPIKPVVLTFDDGYPDTYSIVYPTLKKYGLQGTVFINPGDVGQRLTWVQIKEMHDGGMTIANHGYQHVRMGPLSTIEQGNNIDKAQKALQEHLGITNVYFCYPYGDFTKKTEEIAKEKGIKLGLAMDTGWAHKGDNPLHIKRVWIGNAVTLPYFKERISTENFHNFD